MDFPSFREIGQVQVCQHKRSSKLLKKLFLPLNHLYHVFRLAVILNAIGILYLPGRRESGLFSGFLAANVFII